MSSRAELEVMEVAPPLRDFRDKTTLLAARYFRQTIASTLRVEL